MKVFWKKKKWHGNKKKGHNNIFQKAKRINNYD